MSRVERDVLKVMSGVLCGKRTQVEAGRLLSRSTRQVRRLQRRMEVEGDGGVVHRLRGRASNHRLGEASRGRILSLARGCYGGFGPTLLQEKLSEEHGLTVSVETVRGLLLQEGLWQRRRRSEKHRIRREREACFGAMVLADASVHDWFSTGERVTLVGMIDDATGRILVRFFPAETSFAYREVLRDWVRSRGRPVKWYTDRHSIFHAESKLLGEGEPIRVPTQFSRALEELGIELVLAGSPQAKGRIERLWGTLQDRWVKELKMRGITTIEAANALLEKKLIGDFNRRFGKVPASEADAHLPVDKTMNLPAIFSHQEQRTVANDYTIQFEKVTYQLLLPAWPGERGGKVIVEKRLDGRMKVRFKERYLEFKAIEPRQTAEEAGALPPAPRSLAPEAIPAARKKKTNGAGDQSPAPPAVHRAGRRSGRTPALPCPPAGGSCGSGKNAWSPAPAHPWRQKAVA